MFDTLTEMIATYLVEEKTEPLGIPTRDIIRDTNVKYIISEHIRQMCGDVDRCIKQYLAKSRSQQAPAIPAIIKYLEYDKAEGSYSFWGEEYFNLAYTLADVKVHDLDQNDQDSLWCAHKAKELALIHWDGCEFELEYNDEDWLNYRDWRLIQETGTPLVTITTVPSDRVAYKIDRAIIFDSDICIELANIGEGIDGDYNPDNEDDIELLRLTLYGRNPDTDVLEWSEEIAEYQMGLSTCTQIPAITNEPVIGKILRNIYDKVRPAYDDPEHNESLKHIVDAASWLSDERLEIPDFRSAN